MYEFSKCDKNAPFRGNDFPVEHGFWPFYCVFLSTGGDRRTLTPSGCVIENNRIWDFSRAAAVGSHGIALGGVGTHVQYNEVSGGRYTGIWWGVSIPLVLHEFIKKMLTLRIGGIKAPTFPNISNKIQLADEYNAKMYASTLDLSKLLVKLIKAQK